MSSVPIPSIDQYVVLPCVDQQDIAIPIIPIADSDTGEVSDIEAEEKVAHRNSLR
jgi:hypothetical protein